MSKIRVREIAKELGKNNKEIMEVLEANGVEGKTAASNLDEEHVKLIKNHFAKDDSSKKENKGNVVSEGILKLRT